MFFWSGCWVFSKTQKRRLGAKVESLKLKDEGLKAYGERG